MQPHEPQKASSTIGAQQAVQTSELDITVSKVIVRCGVSSLATLFELGSLSLHCGVVFPQLVATENDRSPKRAAIIVLSEPLYQVQNFLPSSIIESEHPIDEHAPPSWVCLDVWMVLRNMSYESSQAFC